VTVRAEDKPDRAAVNEDADVEALEAIVKSRKGVKAAERASFKGKQQEPPAPGDAVWKEGALFPEGWEDMNPLEKVTELYLGQRGVLFWANKAAFSSIFILIAAWIMFRFVGPAMGLYQLQNDLMSPSF
jgi:hypothetical protein